MFQNYRFYVLIISLQYVADFDKLKEILGEEKVANERLVRQKSKNSESDSVVSYVRYL